jgi:spore germination cell wall hydrolase CwlJ-like protein
MKWYTPYILGIPLALSLWLYQPVSQVSYPLVLPKTVSSLVSSDKHCLVSALYFEARDQSAKGQKAVAQVIHNRARATGQGYCQVITEPNQFTAIQGKALEITLDNQAVPVFKSFPDVKAWQQIKSLVDSGKYRPSHKDLVKGSTFYARKDVKPFWARGMKRVATIGDHTFYKPRG